MSPSVLLVDEWGQFGPQTLEDAVDMYPAAGGAYAVDEAHLLELVSALAQRHTHRPALVDLAKHAWEEGPPPVLWFR